MHMRGDVNLRELCLEHIEIPSSEGVFATAPTGEHERRARPGRWRPLGGGRSSLRPSALPDRRNRSAVPGGGGGGVRATPFKVPSWSAQPPSAAPSNDGAARRSARRSLWAQVTLARADSSAPS